MNGHMKTCGTAVALASGAILLAGGAWAQSSGSAMTRSLNTGPAQSTLTPRPNAQPPLIDTPRSPSARPQNAPSRDRTLEDLLGETSEGAADSAPADRPTGVTLATGETEPPPIPMTLGYYVRGEKECDQVWPGEGDLAFLTPTAFTIDYGGCEPGQFLQTGPNSWGEEQRCKTERGGDAGAYNVTYEVLGTDQIKRQARLGDDVDTAEDDLWNFCRIEDVPENARFGS